MEFNFSDNNIFGQSEFFKIDNPEHEHYSYEENKSISKNKCKFEEIIEKIIENKEIPIKILNHNENNPNILDVVYNQLNLSKSREWTASEDSTLLDYVTKYNSRNWKRISEIIKTKTPQQCTYRYQKLIKEKNAMKWSRKEDIKLYELIETYGEDFENIAKYFDGRTSKQLEERYRKKLDPRSRNTTFTRQEDILLFNLHKKLGNKWVNISKHFPDKKPDIIKQRYLNYIKKNFCSNGHKNLNGQDKEKKCFPNKTKLDVNENEIANPDIDKLDNNNNEGIYDDIKKEFEQIFKSKMMACTYNEPSIYEFDYRTLRKSETVSTQEISVKNDFNVDSFFEDSNNSIKLHQMYNSIVYNSNLDKNHEYSNNNYLIQIQFFQEQLEKMNKFYITKENDLKIFLESLPSNSLKQQFIKYNSQLNEKKDKYFNELIYLNSELSSSIIPKNRQTFLLVKLKEIFKQISHLTKLKIELFQ